MSAAVGVLGGGPAGAVAALRLARGGLSVKLFHPAGRGEKPCGGAVPQSALEGIEGFDASGLPAVRNPRGVVENARGARHELALRGLRILRRRDLDPALVAAAAAAGARIEPRRVRALRPTGSGVDVLVGDRWERFDWLVAGDGARGLSRRTLGLASGAESVGLGATLEELPADRLVVSFPDLADAYLWIFPRPGGASVGIAYSASRLSHAAARTCLERFLARHFGASAKHSRGVRYRYPIPLFGPRTPTDAARALEARILLVGDAAGMADPLTREGIRPAMRSAVWASEALQAGCPERYLRRLESELETEMRRANVACRLFFDGRLAQWMVPLCRVHRGLSGVLGDLLAGRQSYRGLRRRLLRAAAGRQPRP